MPIIAACKAGTCLRPSKSFLTFVADVALSSSSLSSSASILKNFLGCVADVVFTSDPGNEAERQFSRSTTWGREDGMEKGREKEKDREKGERERKEDENNIV